MPVDGASTGSACRHSSISTTEVYAKANPRKLVDAVANWDEE